ncbi:MAG TPA: molybdopterin-binding/glycosyltransferase family 2 protein [Bauldia sp.]|nr:molybdopterin-binding/glycosyltransferase family 2 protein [Bauldia sp.]
MKFGPVRIVEAAGAILAHSVRLPDGSLRKGTTLTAAHVAQLAAAGIAEVVVARLDVDDVHEDQAAATVAAALAGQGVRAERPFTGRANLTAEVAGVVVIDRAAIDRLNRIDPAITVATVPEYASVTAGQMVATVKIIPFAVSQARLAAATAAAVPLRVAPFHAASVGLVATTLPALKPAVMDKTRRLLDARLAPAGASVMREDRVVHDSGAVAASLMALARAGADLLIAFGASAVVDGDDVIPAAIREAGGEVTRLGMPVDPGNLIVLGHIGDVPVIGAPGCARSPKENGFDWVLARTLAGIPVTSDDIASMGVGGLLTEIASRPQPRSGHASRIAALLLAAGSSRRMGDANKMIATIGGRALVRIAAEAALGSAAQSLTVVTGYAPQEVETALAGLDVDRIHNPDFAGGLSTSLRAGIASLGDDLDGAVVLLADMPAITSATVDRLVEAFRPGSIVVPVFNGQRGNPVVWPRRFFPELMAVTGDTGGRRLIEEHRDMVIEVELGADVALDVDTPDALAAVGGQPG